MKTKNMTVKALIKRLQTLPKKMGVVTAGYEGGYSDIVDINKFVKIKRSVHKEWYYGQHDEDPSGDEYLVL